MEEGGAWHTVLLPQRRDAGWEQEKKLKATFMGRSLGFQCVCVHQRLVHVALHPGRVSEDPRTHCSAFHKSMWIVQNDGLRGFSLVHILYFGHLPLPTSDSLPCEQGRQSLSSHSSVHHFCNRRFPLEKKPGDSKGGVGGLCILRGKGVLSIEFHHSSLSLNPQLGGEGNGPAPLVF